MTIPDPRPLALEVRAREQLTPLITRVVVGGDDLIGFEFAPGQDLMLAVPTDANTVDGATINRRYTIRRADPVAGTVDLDFVVHGDGPGARWATDAPLGSSIAAVGPRGKVVPATTPTGICSSATSRAGRPPRPWSSRCRWGSGR